VGVSGGEVNFEGVIFPRGWLPKIAKVLGKPNAAVLSSHSSHPSHPHSNAGLYLPPAQDEDEPFARKITQKLAQSWQALQAAVTEVATSDDFPAFEQRIAMGGNGTTECIGDCGFGWRFVSR
jgi:hypothetical protein